MFIDADAHIDECVDTWSYFPKSLDDLRPIPITFEYQPGYVERRDGPKTGLFIDGAVFGQFIRDDEVTRSTLGIRRLQDIPARLKYMDGIDVETQVIYPTLLLFEVTRRPELEVAICESYNRWLGDRCVESGGRLRWTASLPLRSMPEALREMRRVKEAGAVGIFKRPVETDDRRVDDPYFLPMYELAQELELPICIHTSAPFRLPHPLLAKTERNVVTVSLLLDAFVAFLRGRIHERFPRLRVGFIEAGAGWLPYGLWLTSFQEANGMRSSNDLLREQSARTLEQHNLFITCEASENLPDIIRQVGDDNLGVGTDYVHTDRATQLNVHQEVAALKEISAGTAAKLTSANASRFYGLSS